MRSMVEGWKPRPRAGRDRRRHPESPPSPWPPPSPWTCFRVQVRASRRSPNRILKHP